MRNHMGEREYLTWSGWRRAVKAAGAICVDGSKDIAQALDEQGHAIGAWDGAVGTVYPRKQETAYAT